MCVCGGRGALTSYQIYLPTANLRRLSFHRCLSVRGGGGAEGGHVWQGVCVWQGGMHGRGCVWQGGVHGRGVARPPGRYYEIRSMIIGMHSCHTYILYFILPRACATYLHVLDRK